MYSFLRTSLVVMFMLAGRAPVEAATMLSLTQASNNQSGSTANRNRSQLNKDLSGLYQLENLTNSHITQPYTDFESLYLHAHQAQAELSTLTHQVALLSATQALVPAIKSQERAQYKLANKLDGDIKKLTDLARSSIIAKNSQQLMNAYEQLSNNAEIVQVKNRFNEPKKNGYRDINLLVRLPKSKMIVEVQLHLNRMQAIKNGPEHDNYVEMQEIAGLAQQENRPISEIELFKMDQLEKESTALYQAAWQQQLMTELKTSFKQIA